jgi:nicotinamidase-related amidase
VTDFQLIRARTALINVDLQNCFVAGSEVSAPDGPVVLDRVNRFADSCRRAGILVVHTRFVLRPDGSNAGVLAEIAPPVKAGILNDGSRSAAFHPGLTIGADDLVVEKPRFGAFHRTELETILRARGIDTLMISGLMSNVCCETTAREAMMRDFHVFFLADGTATGAMGGLSPDELHRSTLATLRFLIAEVLTIEQMTRKIARAVT